MSLSSAYAAPNTPIASAKRPRKSPRAALAKRESTEINSPIAKVSKSKLSIGTSYNEGSSNILQTPSKILFSPLRQANGDIRKLEPLRAPSLPAASNDDDDTDEFNPYLFMASLPPHATTAIQGKICLPPKSEKLQNFPTLVLDLDETLVHCTVEPINNADLQFPVNFNGNRYDVYVRKRPFLDHFLQEVSKNFEVVVFTASQKIYAETLLNMLDPEGKLIHHRLYREACLFVQGNFLKDLSVLDRNLKTTIIIDNSPHAYGYQINNGIPIESWFDDDDDEELLKVLDFLSDLIAVNNPNAIQSNLPSPMSLTSNSSPNRMLTDMLNESTTSGEGEHNEGNNTATIPDTEEITNENDNEDIIMNKSNSTSNNLQIQNSARGINSSRSNLSLVIQPNDIAVGSGISGTRHLRRNSRSPTVSYNTIVMNEDFDVRNMIREHFKTYQLIDECKKNIMRNIK